MANEQNLRPCEYKLTTEDSRKGGIASGEARRERRKLREDLEYLLSCIDKESGKTNQELIAEAAVAKARTGDARMIEMIRDTVGEKPDQNMNLTADIGLSDADRALLKEANKLYASRT